MSDWFISDLHLQDDRPELTQAFLGLVETSLSECQALYILGDLFEYWIGDDYLTDTSKMVAESLLSRHEAGLQSYFIHGNRDFLIGQSYAELCGMKLLPARHVTILQDRPTLLMHGDELCTGDIKYQQFRQWVRSPLWQQNFLQMPIDQRLAMAGQARHQSRQTNSAQTENLTDVDPDAVRKAMQDHSVELLIHGHTHRPARHTVEGVGERIVLGDWGVKGWCLESSDSGLRLIDFTITPE
jgi:UDP-2,3-diacylglucosamine hydrolase